MARCRSSRSIRGVPIPPDPPVRMIRLPSSRMTDTAIMRNGAEHIGEENVNPARHVKDGLLILPVLDLVHQRLEELHMFEVECAVRFEIVETVLAQLQRGLDCLCALCGELRAGSFKN